MRIELRKMPRTARQHDISYHKKTPHQAASNGSEPLIATILDLGPEGAGLLVENPHCVNEQLRLEGHPELNPRQKCVVRWVRKLPENYHLGVQFL